MLFFWDADQKLTGMLLNIACPSQVGRKAISADFWHPIRQGIKEKYGPNVHVFGQCAAAGDQCPAVIVRGKAENLMLKRREISWKEELANRVIRAVDDVWPFAQSDVQTRPVFAHRVSTLEIPNNNSYNEARWKPSTVAFEFHVLRLGDVAIATNPFELFLDYGNPDQGPQQGGADLPLAVDVRPPRISPHPAGRGRRRLQRGEQYRRSARRTSAGR